MWLGLFATSGSIARVVGPLLVTKIYEEFGTYVMLGTVTSTLGVSLIMTVIAYRSLVPPHSNKDKANEEGKDNDKTKERVNENGKHLNALSEEDENEKEGGNEN